MTPDDAKQLMINMVETVMRLLEAKMVCAKCICFLFCRMLYVFVLCVIGVGFDNIGLDYDERFN